MQIIQLLSMPGGGEWFIIALVGLWLYFIPSIIARSTDDFTGVFLLNLLLGWTALGWLGALIWAINSKSNIKSRKQHEELLRVIDLNISESIVKTKSPADDTNFEEKSNYLVKLSQLTLLRNKGIITEENYQREKAEIELSIKPIHNEVTYKTEASKSNYEIPYDPVYDELFKKRHWYSKKIVWFISLLFLGILLFVYRFFYFTTDEGKITAIDNRINLSKELTGLYFVKQLKNNERAYFYSLPDEEYKSKKYLVSFDEVNVQKIENSFGFIEYMTKKGYVISGWLKMEYLVKSNE